MSRAYQNTKTLIGSTKLFAASQVSTTPPAQQCINRYKCETARQYE